MLFRSHSRSNIMAKGSNGNNRPRGTTQRLVYPQRVRDTINVTTDNITRAFSMNELAPSFAGRTLIPQKFFVEVLPAFTAGDTPQMANVLWQHEGQSTKKISSGTFKMLSSVNPTNFVIDLVHLQKFVPGVLVPYPSNDLTDLLVFNKTESLINVTLRITSHFLLMPQENLSSSLP